MTEPILYSFRRCPYAMRARLAIASAGIRVELREILLRDKAPEFVAASPKATVPVLVGENVIEESYEIMLWALAQNDPEGLLPEDLTPTHRLVADLEANFKPHLDRAKYANRYKDNDPDHHRAIAGAYLSQLDAQLSPNLGGAQLSLADLAVLPFIRQFAFSDRTWFDAQPWVNIQPWLENFLASARLSAIMTKNETWSAGADPVWFP